MIVSYYPGCTLKNKAKQLHIYARKCAEILGVQMIEPENWQCCGGVFTSSSSEIATKLSSVRALHEAAQNNRPLVTVCSACHNVLKQTNHQIQTNPDFALRVNNYNAPDMQYHGEAEVIHYLEFLRDKIGFDKVAEKAVKPLKDKKIAAYYGCLLLRPSSTMKLDDPENPQIMENLIRALGGEPVIYSNRNECCGAYMATEDPQFAAKRSIIIAENAAAQGADMIVTACPLCRYNLEKHTDKLPVVYFTELMAQAFGIKEESECQ